MSKSDDLISRRAALDVLDDFQSNIELGIDDYAEKRKALCDLPSADRPSGEWINIDTKLFRVQCSACGEWSDVVGNYCPWCGAKMV